MTVDAIVIGAGLNGLVAAVQLARDGWSTMVVERNEQVGGAVRSGELTEPGLVHDTYATNLNLFAGSPAFAELGDDLARHGFELAASDKPYANAFPDGTALRVFQDPDRTHEELEARDPADAAGWDELAGHFEQFAEHLLPLYFTAMPSTRAAMGLAQAVRHLGLDESQQLARILLSSTRELGDRYFATPEARAMIATWGLHMDYGPDVSGGAMFPFIETFSDMQQGISIAKGGAGRLPEALVGLLREPGGEVRTGAEVRQVLVEDGRATGVELADGERITARRAVVANLTPTVLFDGLVDEDAVPEEFREQVDDYQYGPGTMMVHVALSGPIPWQAEGLDEFAYVHLPPYVDDLARTYTEAVAGQIPSSPLLIVGQTSTVDPTRTPDDRHIAWIQVRALPSEIAGDAAGEITARDWDEAKEAVADRVMAKLAEYAPGVQDLVTTRTVLSPADLERDNPNLVGGDSIGGSHHLSQNFLFRPFPGWSTYDTPIEALHMVGAGTWPGGGTNAASGYLAAQRLVDPPPSAAAMAGAAGGAVAALAAAGAGLRRLRGRNGA